VSASDFQPFTGKCINEQVPVKLDVSHKIPILQSRYFLNPETEVIDKLSKAFGIEGIHLNGAMSRSLINFSKLRRQLLVYKEVGSRRQAENDWNHRVTAIKHMAEQDSRDRKCLSWSGGDFIERQLLVALVEKASLIYLARSRGNLRQKLSIAFHLWVFRRHLVEMGIVKPVETLAHILEFSGALDGLGGPWQASTIHTKCSLVQGLVERSKKAGACHEPSIGLAWPRVHSAIFVHDLSRGCDGCEQAWTKALRLKKAQGSPVELAAQELAKKLPKLAQAVRELPHKLKVGMRLEEYMVLPQSLFDELSSLM